jgi:hypothetical protein
MLVEDFDCYFDAWGTDAVLAGVAVRGILDLESVDEFGTVTQQPSFLLKPTTAVGGSVGQQLLVSGAEVYTVRQHIKEPPDGALVRLVLVRG